MHSLNMSENQLILPINNTKVIYDPKEDESYLLFGNKRLKLSEGSSGFHSRSLIYWVTKYLIEFVKQGEKKKNLELLSTDQTIRRNNELRAFNRRNFWRENIEIKREKDKWKYVCKYLVNIVEEPESRIYSLLRKKSLLNSLLAFNNSNNMLIMTTHSPYLLIYLTLSVKLIG